MSASFTQTTVFDTRDEHSDWTLGAWKNKWQRDCLSRRFRIWTASEIPKPRLEQFHHFAMSLCRNIGQRP